MGRRFVRQKSKVGHVATLSGFVIEHTHWGKRETIMIRTILSVCLINLDRRRKANCVVRSRIFYIPHYLLILGFVASGLQLPTVAHAQSFRIVDVGNGCKTYDLDDVEKPYRHVWSGECSNGYTDGWGVLKRYKGNKLAAIGYEMHKQGSLVTDQVSETYYRPKLIAKNSSNLKDNIVQSKADPKQGTVENIVPPSQVPEWAREIVDGRPRQATLANLASQQPSKKSSSTAVSSSQTGTSRETKSGGASYNHRLMVLYNNEAFAAPTVVHDDAMLQAIIAQHRENLEYNQADSVVLSKECQQGSSNGPYFGFVHYQAVGRGRRQAWGLSCGASSPEEAFQLAQRACESNSSGGRCAVDTSAETHRRVIIIGDRRIVSGRKEAEARDVSVLIRESYADAQSGHMGGANLNVNFSEGYVCRWTGIISDSRYWGGRRFQMDVNGPFTWGISRPVGQYEFNCGSK